MTFFHSLRLLLCPNRKVWLRRLTTGLPLAFLALCGLVVLWSPSARAKPSALGTQQIIINEIAWMGTLSDANHEWIELYNPGSVPVDLTGWRLQAADGTPNILLSGVIPAGGFFLLERDELATSVSSDQTYTGALGNGPPGETLQLFDNSSPTPILIDTANFPTGSSWPQGNNTTKCTMERIGPLLDEPASWGTSLPNTIAQDNSGNYICGSPKAQNSQFITPTVTPSPTNTPEWALRLLINEVAWGGTQADDTLAQWIELYNPGPDLDLTGLYLRIPTKGDIFLSGTLPANGYYLIERNEADTSAPASLVMAFPFLDPVGDSLFLYAPGGILIDSANADGGPWPAGSRFFTYTSMERAGPPYSSDSDSTWLNFFGTPYALDRLGNLINGSPGGPNSPGATSTPTFAPTPTSTATLTPTRTTTPTPAVSMAIIINEVAWMGTAANANHEWIELHNPSTTAIDISGWKLTTSDNTLSIPLSGIIPAGGYFLLERSDDTTVSDIPADQIYTGSLANNGRVLRLLSPSNQVIDTANGNDGAWPAGNASPSFCSMERRAVGGVPMADSDFAWITNAGVLKNGKDANGNDICGTPKNINWAFYVTPTPTLQKTATPVRTATRTRTPTPNRATPEPIVINEFLPHARADYNGDGVIDSGDEFIEIINLGGAAVNLNNYRLDDQQGDSSPYTITGVTLQPGMRVAFFASQTGILLSNGGDSVRLFKPNGQIADAFTYVVLKELDRAWCRYPDGKFIPAGQSNWTFGCLPSPGRPNERASTERIGMEELPLVCKSPKLPFGIYLSECDRLGLWNWNSAEAPLLSLPPWLEAEGTLFIFE